MKLAFSSWIYNTQTIIKMKNLQEVDLQSINFISLLDDEEKASTDKDKDKDDDDSKGEGFIIPSKPF